MNFAAAAAELRQQEISRLSDAIVPRLEAMRRMTPETFRALIADMLQRFGHHIVNDPTAPDLITTKGEKKFVTRCAVPTDLKPISTRELAAFHIDAVIGANAERGYFITARSFTEAAIQYAKTAPLDLFDGTRLVKALNQSRKYVLMPQTYKAMCQQCGAIVEHRLDREQDEARPCSNGHSVAPTIARAMLLPPRPAGWKGGEDAPKPSPHPYSRREVNRHNAKYEARMMRKPRG